MTLPYCFFFTFLRQRCHIFIEPEHEKYNKTKLTLNLSQITPYKKVFPSFLHPLCPMWAQRGTFICTIIVLNLNISFNIRARLGVNVIFGL